MAKIKPLATLDKTVNGHRLLADKWTGHGWIFRCPSWPDLETFSGIDDACQVLDEFERRATAGVANGNHNPRERSDP